MPSFSPEFQDTLLSLHRLFLFLCLMFLCLMFHTQKARQDIKQKLGISAVALTYINGGCQHPTRKTTYQSPQRYAYSSILTWGTWVNAA